MPDTAVERVLSINDYQQAIDTLGKVRAKALAGKKLSRKDQAILVYAADSVAAHRSADLLRDALPTPPLFAPAPGPGEERVALAIAQIDPERMAEIDLERRIEAFRGMLYSGERAASNGLLIGEKAYAASVKADFERVFAPELGDE
ncbi:hypothetical protein SEA_EMIANNA_15 [Gordonia phage Emianna]|uniref:Uncharacterized protein n=1 Tax=Gordonia phage Emianna TaxID=2315530 RepID=A0A386KDF1_9CAUD|nr:hypothetical protein KNU15_gp15 [Gordonia phage Emianna]AYD83400.1 hypothetical protein SEA_EMIANNA_15 [Gordonia phage Emianna]AYD84287.1 hypothetical protein SEA_KURT_15 [Gordonia phage Kurt]